MSSFPTPPASQITVSIAKKCREDWQKCYDLKHEIATTMIQPKLNFEVSGLDPNKMYQVSLHLRELWNGIWIDTRSGLRGKEPQRIWLRNEMLCSGATLMSNGIDFDYVRLVIDESRMVKSRQWCRQYRNWLHVETGLSYVSVISIITYNQLVFCQQFPVTEFKVVSECTNEEVKKVKEKFQYCYLPVGVALSKTSSFQNNQTGTSDNRQSTPSPIQELLEEDNDLSDPPTLEKKPENLSGDSIGDPSLLGYSSTIGLPSSSIGLPGRKRGGAQNTVYLAPVKSRRPSPEQELLADSDSENREPNGVSGISEQVNGSQADTIENDNSEQQGDSRAQEVVSAPLLEFVPGPSANAFDPQQPFGPPQQVVPGPPYNYANPVIFGLIPTIAFGQQLGLPLPEILQIIHYFNTTVQQVQNPENSQHGGGNMHLGQGQPDSIQQMNSVPEQPQVPQASQPKPRRKRTLQILRERYSGQSSSLLNAPQGAIQKNPVPAASFLVKPVKRLYQLDGDYVADIPTPNGKINFISFSPAEYAEWFRQALPGPKGDQIAAFIVHDAHEAILIEEFIKVPETMKIIYNLNNDELFEIRKIATATVNRQKHSNYQKKTKEYREKIRLYSTQPHIQAVPSVPSILSSVQQPIRPKKGTLHALENDCIEDLPAPNGKVDYASWTPAEHAQWTLQVMGGNKGAEMVNFICQYNHGGTLIELYVSDPAQMMILFILNASQLYKMRAFAKATINRQTNAEFEMQMVEYNKRLSIFNSIS